MKKEIVYKWFLLLVLRGMLLLFPFLSFGQSFPVQANPSVVPPYSLKLSEYGTGLSEKIILNLVLTDVSEFNLQVRLKLYIENNAGISVQSTETVIGAKPIFLDGGIPLRLTNVDLKPYFSLRNLNGITPQQYNKPFPEGLYRFCFEIYEAFSDRIISRKSCAVAYLVLNDPPFLNLPNRAEQITVKEPQNIIFQWTPRHLNATNVAYEFTLAEIWDTQMDPQAAFLASRPLYQTETFANTLLYGPAEPALLPDKLYGWRVRALVSDGISETSVFKNNGYSEVYHFTYADNCKEPAYVLAESKSPVSQKILWQADDHIRYNVQYRNKAAKNSVWFDIGTVNEFASIYNLEPATSYEFRVGGQCLENGSFTYSQIYEFTTSIPGDDTATYSCGITPEIVITNRKPLEALVVNDVFTAGDFPVTVKFVGRANTNASGVGQPVLASTGNYSGWGFITVPYLENTKIKVSFDNIQINSDYQLTEGVVYTDYDQNWGGVDDIGNELDLLVNSFGQLISLWEELTTVYQNIKENGDQYTEEQWQTATDQYDTTMRLTSEQISLYEDAGIIDEAVAQTMIKNLGASQTNWKAMADCYQTDQKNEKNNTGKGGIIEDCSTYNQNSQEQANQVTSQLQEIQNHKVDREKKIYKILLALQTLDGDAFIKCKKCEENPSDAITENIDGTGVFRIEALNFNSTAFIRCISGRLMLEDQENPIKFEKYDTSQQITEQTKESLKNEFTSFNEALNSDNQVLAVRNSKSVVICTTPLSFTNFCNNSNEVSEVEKQELANELATCLSTTQSSVTDLEQITVLLKNATEQLRANQRVSFEQGANIYSLNNLGIAAKQTDALSNDQINNGEWKDRSVENMMRLSYNEKGVLQFTGLGFHKDITNLDGKEIDLTTISSQIREQTNAIFLEYEIKKLETTLNDLGANFNSTDGFPDGRNIEIDKESGFMKLVSEGLGVATTFAKTTKIEEAVYTSYNTAKTDQIIKAPPILTGATEAGGKKITELTSMVVMIYDLVFDKDIRKQTVDGFVAIKDQIKDDPSRLFPLLKDAIIEEVTGSDSNTMSQIDVNTAKGQHVTSKASVSIVVTVIAGTKFIMELPKIAKKIATKLSSADLLKLIKEGSEVLTQKIDELGNLKGKFMEDLVAMKDDIAKFIENPDLIDAWKIVSNGKASLRNIKNINAIDAFKRANPNIADDALQAAFDGLKASRRQAFVNGLKNVADNDLGLTKARKALPDEVAKSVNNLRDFRKSRTDIIGRSNIGKLDGTINGRSVSELSEHNYWVGGEQNILTSRPPGQARIWQADVVQTKNGYSYLADIDSEYNMLTDLARKLEPNAKLGDKFMQHTGQLKIVSEIAYCKSCQGIIQKFNNMFPEIKIILIDGIK